MNTSPIGNLMVVAMVFWIMFFGLATMVGSQKTFLSWHKKFAKKVWKNNWKMILAFCAGVVVGVGINTPH
ncbi:MAG: hypothetical protein ACI9GH_000101 [Candidatus Paceibacteria bacterium]|jgi:hypothetical protein